MGRPKASQKITSTPQAPPRAVKNGARGTFIVHQDELSDFLGGRITAADDPMGLGVKGPFPKLTTRATHSLRRHLAKNVGLYRSIVRKPAGDVWSAGWEIITTSPELKLELDRFDRNVRVYPTHRHIKAAFKRAHILARRDGRSLLLLRLRDATGDSAQPPRGVTGILEARAIPGDLIKRVRLVTDANDPRHGQPAAWEVFLKRGDSSSVRTYHWQRVLPVIPEPNEDEGEFDGESELDANLGNATGRQNIMWAGTEAFYQRAAPYLVVTLRDDIVRDVSDTDSDNDTDLDHLEKKVRDLQSGVVQKIILDGAEIKTLTGSEQINDPTPFVRMHVEDAAAASGIPKRELTGSEAGALQAAGWDEKRYFSSVITPLQDEFATGLVLEWYSRIREWGLVRSQGEVEGLIWYPYIQLDEKERATLLVQATAAMRQLAGIRWVDPQGTEHPFPLPKELQALVTWPSEVPTDAGVTAPPPAPMAFPLGGLNGRTRRVGRDLRIEVSPELRRIEDELEASVRRLFRDELKRALQEARARVPEGRLLDRLLRRNAPEITYTFPQADLEAAIQRYLTEAAELGLLQMWKALGMEGVLQFLDTPEAPKLSARLRNWTIEKADVVTRQVREVAARVLAEGGARREVEIALEKAFGRLENLGTIARNEAMRGYNVGSHASMREAGVREWEWRTYAGACPICAPFEGQRFPVGDVASLPPDGSHPGCRCVPVPVLESGL